MKRPRLQKQKRSFDKGFLILVFLFVLIGLIAVADASAPLALSQFGDKFYFLKQQLVWAGIGIAAFLVFSYVPYKFWEKVATPFFIASVALLFAVLLPHFGFLALGARRWITLGFLSLQPSELIKFSLSIFFAKVAASGKSSLSFFIPLVIVAGLIMLQPDLGTTLIILIIAFAQIFASGVSLFYFGISLVVGFFATVGLILVSAYRRARLMTFFNTLTDPLDSSYHIRQVLLGLGSGGIFGVGLGASRQKYLFLPESATDSIFAILAEEIGFLGAIIIIFLFVYFLFKGLKIAMNAPDRFSQILALGIVAWIAGQAFLNIGSMVALVPLTGIPLPFISYGGSSLVMILTGCGILLNISKYETK